MATSLALQRAVAAALAADAAVAARGLRVFDGAPADARAPYLALGTDLVTDWGWKGGEGFEHRFEVVLWDLAEGLAAAKAALGEVERAVLAMPRAIVGGRVATLRLARAFVRRGPRQWTQGVLEFRALVAREQG
jgi:hypothetical protein